MDATTVCKIHSTDTCASTQIQFGLMRLQNNAISRKIQKRESWLVPMIAKKDPLINQTTQPKPKPTRQTNQPQRKSKQPINIMGNQNTKTAITEDWVDVVDVDIDEYETEEEEEDMECDGKLLFASSLCRWHVRILKRS